MDVLLVFTQEEIDELREFLRNEMRSNPNFTYKKMSDEIGISRSTLTTFLIDRKKKGARYLQSGTVAAIKNYVDKKKKVLFLS